MTFRIHLTGSLLVLALFSSIPGLKLELKPFFEKSLGYHRMVFDYPEFTETNYQGYSVDLVGRTEVAYPAGAGCLGIMVSTNGSMLRAGYATNRYGSRESALGGLAQPAANAEDADFAGVSGNVGGLYSETKIKLSYMESMVDLKQDRLMAAINFKPVELLNIPLNLELGYQWNGMQYDLLGMNGWQYFVLDPLDSIVSYDGTAKKTFNVHEGEIIQNTSLNQHLLEIGLTYHVADPGRFSWEPGLVLSPLVFFFHRDHLLLINKTRKSLCWGFLAGLVLDFNFKMGESMNLHLGSGARYFRTWGTMEQVWEGDNPTTPNDDTGRTVGDLPVIISSITGALQLGLEYQF